MVRTQRTTKFAMALTRNIVPSYRRKPVSSIQTIPDSGLRRYDGKSVNTEPSYLSAWAQVAEWSVATTKI
jgi:hypothetical protein